MGIATILFLGAAQAAFLVALIGSKREKTLADGVLAAWVSVLGLHHLLYALAHQGILLPTPAMNLNAGVTLLQGPFLYLYVDTLTSGRRQLRWMDALHLFPFLGFSGYVLLLLPRLGAAHSPEISVFQISHWITAAILASVPVYAAVSLWRLRRHGAATREWYSECRGRDLTWLRRIVLALLALWAVVISGAIATVLAPSSPLAAARHQVMSAVTLFIYAIGYFGWRQFAVIGREDIEPFESSAEGSEGKVRKYERSGLKNPEIEAMVERLEVHLESERPYLETGVTLRQIAANLGTTPNRLSQAINQGMDRNFHELINQRRVEAFKRLAIEPRNRHRTLLAVALDSGFSSKSSFNRVFKQLTGMSPRRYLDSQGRPEKNGPAEG